jgi:S-adenosylmethionine:tRNA ribosyltransferase-isomerase
LLALDRETGAIAHHAFAKLPGLLRKGDLLVVNDTRVIPARLFGTLMVAGRAGTCSTGAGVGPRVGGGSRATDTDAGARSAGRPSRGATTPRAAREVEVLLLREEPAVAPERIWSALARPARALQPGLSLSFLDPAYAATVVGMGERGVRHIAFRPTRPDAPPFETWLSRIGHVPLPPYINRPDEPEDRVRYQTLFARDPGSVAAPTAGLHFTPEVLEALAVRGITLASVTLHVGPGTFRPVATEDPTEHLLDSEPYRVPPETARAIAVGQGCVVAVGTTSVRALESWALAGRPEDGAWRETGLFILPSFEFQVVEGLITNFHLPRSSLLILVSAFAGRERVLAAYGEAVRQGYRFYSYGDAMLIL